MYFRAKTTDLFKSSDELLPCVLNGLGGGGGGFSFLGGGNAGKLTGPISSGGGGMAPIIREFNFFGCGR